MSELAINKDTFKQIQRPWIEQSGLSEENFQKEVSFAMQHFQKNPYLLKCSKDSIIKSVLNIAQTGLTLNPVQKYAYLVPRSVNGSLECCLDPSYMGLVKLLTDTGSVTSISAQIIYENDGIEVDMASPDKVLKHVPYFLLGKEKGLILGAYSKAILYDGSTHAEMMSYKDLSEIRDRSESYKAFKNGKIKTCIWVTDEPEMCRKTVIKRHWKYLPKSDKTEKFDKAIDLDNYANGFDDPVDFTMISLCESLINSSTLNEQEKIKAEKELALCETTNQARKLYGYLSEHQPKAGRDKVPHSAKEVQEAVNYQADKETFYERK